MPAPEARARQAIDAKLAAAGWVVQDYTAFDKGAGLGVAVREYPLPGGPPDYLLFVEGKAARWCSTRQCLMGFRLVASLLFKMA